MKRKEIKKTEPIRCIIDTANDPHEISLDENGRMTRLGRFFDTANAVRAARG